VGRDSFADFILRILNNHKVDTSGIKQTEKRATAFTFAAINKKGERGFFHYTGANEELKLEDIDFNLIKDSQILHIAGSYLMPQFDGEPTAKVLQKAKEYGITTSLDTAWNSTVKNWQEMIEPCLPHLDIILPAIEEARMFTGKSKEVDIADHLLGYGIKIVGLKMGGKGCYIKSRKEEIYLPAYPVKVMAFKTNRAICQRHRSSLCSTYWLHSRGKNPGRDTHLYEKNQLIFYSFPRFYPLAEGMLDLLYLAYQICFLDYLVRGIPASQDNLKKSRFPSYKA